jgi:hypothetical protein
LISQDWGFALEGELHNELAHACHKENMVASANFHEMMADAYISLLK